MRVTIHHTDGVNAYSSEVAALLVERGASVTVVDARNGEHRPPRPVRWKRRLPANFGRERALTQVARLLFGLATTVWASVVRREVVVVSYTRFPLEDLAFAVLARLGRPVVVVLHNPEPRVDESGLRRWTQDRLLGAATTVIIHAERLRDQLPPGLEPRVRVCPHPPYAHSTAEARRAAPAGGPGPRRWLAFVGTLRWDKGHDLVAEVLSLVPPATRSELGLVVCGRGALPEGDDARIRELGIELRDLTSPAPIPQELLLSVLAERPLVLAPYVAATQSGTVILALSMGCRVLAFDQGGIADVLSSDGLVPTGDLAALAAAIAEGRGGGARSPLGTWAREVGDAWWQVLRNAEGPPRS